MTRSTWLHLRIPFSLFLMPIYLLSVTASHHIDIFKLMLSFVIIHLFLYPASNGFNSYYDRDEESIGGLKNPPAVTKDLLWVSLLFDLAALLLGFFISAQFVLCLFLYGLASKAYSHDKIRLKKRPVIGWLGTGLIQGAFTFFMSYGAINKTGYQDLFKPELVLLAVLTSLFLLASYPMTQVYQHKEDGRRGDRTISLVLGIKGTFIFTAVFFGAVTLGFCAYYFIYYGLPAAFIFICFQLPVMVYFLLWLKRVYRDEKEADFTSAMRLNIISSAAMSLFCAVLLIFFYY